MRPGVLFIVILCVSQAGITLASSQNANLKVSLLADTQVAQAGYQHGWVQHQASLAEDAYNNDELHVARRLWVAMAEQGVTEAAFRLGMMYDTGTGVARDAARATYWYRRAAEDGHIHAQHNLAVAYASGDGIELDFHKALRWWQRAAAAGNSDSQYNLGIVYAMGIHGVSRDIDLAKKWWRKAAIKGDAMAQYNLGTLYVNGEDHVTSYCEATRWWEKSAEKGIQQASWALAVIKSRRDYQSCW